MAEGEINGELSENLIQEVDVKIKITSFILTRMQKFFAFLQNILLYLDIAEGTMFIGLMRYNNKYGSPYKLCFGPKSFLVISDPVQAKYILRDANTSYDKGILAEILKPIMGKGLIPADPKTW